MNELDLDQRNLLLSHGICWSCGNPLADSPLSRCADCRYRVIRRRTQPQTSILGNPYREVWNNLKKEEADWISDDTQFTPSYDIMGDRHAATAKALLLKARELGNTPTGQEVFYKATAHVRIAKHLKAQHVLVTRRST